MYEKFKQYKESTIYSMSNLELLLLLYDEAVKRLKMAQIALEDKNMRLLKNILKNRTDRPVFNTDTGYAVSHQQGSETYL